jgi:hypothetical protein
MPKKRKTRKQKIQFDQKRQAVHEIPPVIASQKNDTRSSPQTSTVPDVAFSLPRATEEKKSAPETVTSKETVVTVPADDYGYLGIDLAKTAIVTCAIVVTEIVIRILFRG